MHQVRVQAGSVNVEGQLIVPEGATSIVVFARCISRSRDDAMAKEFNEYGMATLVFDLLTQFEDEQLRFDISLLTERLEGAIGWIKKRTEIKKMDIGLIATSTGAAAALSTASNLGQSIAAVVSLAGRADLAGKVLRHIISPTLLIVGEKDDPIIDLNQSAYQELNCEKRMELVPAATHLFEETGTLELATHFARTWFLKYL